MISHVIELTDYDDKMTIVADNGNLRIEINGPHCHNCNIGFSLIAEIDLDQEQAKELLKFLKANLER